MKLPKQNTSPLFSLYSIVLCISLKVLDFYSVPLIPNKIQIRGYVQNIQWKGKVKKKMKFRVQNGLKTNFSCPPQSFNEYFFDIFKLRVK